MALIVPSEQSSSRASRPAVVGRDPMLRHRSYNDAPAPEFGRRVREDDPKSQLLGLRHIPDPLSSSGLFSTLSVAQPLSYPNSILS